MADPQSYPLLTFAMRHFNNGPFVEAALRSALAQTYSPLEIVFVDDASTDGGFEVAQRVAARYTGPHRVILSRHESNIGLGGQYDRVLALSRGELIVVADCDDVSLPDRAQRIADAFHAGGARLLGLDSYFDPIDAVGRRLTDVPEALAGSRTGSEVMTAAWVARSGGGPQGATAAFRRSVFEAGHALGALRIGEESALAFRALVLGRMTTIREVLVLRRVHLDNISGSIRTNWSGAQLHAWASADLRRRTRVPAFMSRDLRGFERRGLVSAERAADLRRELRVYARELRAQRVAPRRPWWSQWTLFFLLRRLGMARRSALRRTLIAVAPGLAMRLLRRNPIHRARRPAAR